MLNPKFPCLKNKSKQISIDFKTRLYFLLYEAEILSALCKEWYDQKHKLSTWEQEALMQNLTMDLR